MLISPKKALQIVLENVHPLKAANVPIAEAIGGCLAEDVRADRDLPPTDRSAMDGYAVKASDVSRPPRELRLVGEVAAGAPDRPRVAQGTCVRVLTGAAIPPGADAVVMVEQTRQEGDFVRFLAPAAAGANIRGRAEEVRKGRVVLKKLTALDAAQVGLCASVGRAAVKVYRRPEPVILCTGAELRPAGARVGPHQLRDSNGPAIQAALSAAGYGRVSHRIVPDDPAALAAMLKAAAAKHDVIILTGGVSVGKYDYVPEAIERIGATIRFHGVAMKPGKPQLYATLKANRHVFALPGNPLSVLTGLHEFVLPALRRMSGFPAASCRPALRLPLARSIRAKGTRAEYILARLVDLGGGSGVRALKCHGSADLVAGAKADGVIVLPRNLREAPAGEHVEFRPWRRL